MSFRQDHHANEKADFTGVDRMARHKQMRDYSKSESQAELHADNEERFRKLPTERARTRGGILSERLAQAGAARFELFPEDSEGWDLGLNAIPDEKALNDMIALGAKKWPHSPEVFEPIITNLASYKPEVAMRLLEETSESLPSKKDVDAFLHGVKFCDGEESEALNGGQEIRLEQMAAKIRGMTLLVEALGGDKYTERCGTVK